MSAPTSCLPGGDLLSLFYTLALPSGVFPLVYASEYDQQLKMLLLCGLAAGKAILVAQFFMHLNHETAWVKFIASIPIYMGLFAIILMCESIYRQVGA